MHVNKIMWIKERIITYARHFHAMKQKRSM